VLSSGIGFLSGVSLCLFALGGCWCLGFAPTLDRPFREGEERLCGSCVQGEIPTAKGGNIRARVFDQVWDESLELSWRPCYCEISFLPGHHEMILAAAVKTGWKGNPVFFFLFQAPFAGLSETLLFPSFRVSLFRYPSFFFSPSKLQSGEKAFPSHEAAKFLPCLSEPYSSEELRSQDRFGNKTITSRRPLPVTTRTSFLCHCEERSDEAVPPFLSLRAKRSSLVLPHAKEKEGTASETILRPRSNKRKGTKKRGSQ